VKAVKVKKASDVLTSEIQLMFDDGYRKGKILKALSMAYDDMESQGWLPEKEEWMRFLQTLIDRCLLVRELVREAFEHLDAGQVDRVRHNRNQKHRGVHPIR